jgi:hypothetical protein
MVLLGYVLIAVIVAALLFYGVIAMLPDGLSMKPQSDQRPFELPQDRRIGRADLDEVRIPVALRGYRFAETDELIDRLTAELVWRDEELARLRQPTAQHFDVPAQVEATEPAASDDSRQDS